MSRRRPGSRRFSLATLLVAAASLCAGAGVDADAQHPCDVFGDGYVKVIVDMDAAAAGCQANVTVPAETSMVADVAVWLFDPMQRENWGIGYVGGIDRGIAFGHTPTDAALGICTGITPTTGSPVNPGNTIWVSESPALDPGFTGPEVQYIEVGSTAAAPIPADPSQPIFTVNIALADARPGDVFDFYLLDFVTVWSGGGFGAFNTQGLNSLDAGGDVIPDGTETNYGTDPHRRRWSRQDRSRYTYYPRLAESLDDPANLPFDFDRAALLLMPRPLLYISSYLPPDDDTRRSWQASAVAIQRRAAKLGAPQAMKLHLYPGQHAFNDRSRALAYAFLEEHLGDERDSPTRVAGAHVGD